MKQILSCIALSLLTYNAVYADDSSAPGKITGSVFGDFYMASGHNDPSVKGMSGFRFRRIYLTYDKTVDPKLSTRIRLEASSPGDFSSDSTLQPNFKDVWLKLKMNSRSSLTFGLIPTPTFGWKEDLLGYRAVEKTPGDLFRLSESRDQGMSFESTSPDNATRATLMIGNGSGTKGQTGKGHALYSGVQHKLKGGVTLSATGDYWKKADGSVWTTFAGDVVFVNDAWKAGIGLVAQKRDGAGSAPNLNLNVMSLFVAYQANKAAVPFIRLDRVNSLLPDGEKVAYLKLSKEGKPTLLIVGVDYKLTSGLHFVPNIEWVSYQKVSAFTKPKDDVFVRLTFSYSF